MNRKQKIMLWIGITEWALFVHMLIWGFTLLHFLTIVPLGVTGIYMVIKGMHESEVRKPSEVRT